MESISFVTHVVCSECGKNFSHRELQTFCPTCNKPLVAVYDLEKAKATMKKERVAARPFDMWRYRELLPVESEANIVSLGEGCTPLIQLKQAAQQLGVREVWVKDESQTPTASFKARGLAMAVSKALELGVEKLAIPTAGNAGGALAAYAARAGMQSYVFMPNDVPRTIYMEAKLTGAHVELVEGIISDCGRMVAERKDAEGWFDVSTLKEPYRLEGKKTMGLEIAEQFHWQLPEVIIYPTGGGTGLIGMWKAFAELVEMGWLDCALPRMVSVQSEGCDPITRAFRAGRLDSDFFENAETVAAGLRVPKAFGDTLVLKALQESGGVAHSVSEQEILDGVVEIARAYGLNLCPEGAATWAALKRMRDAGELSESDRVVLFNTGSGLKYPEVMEMLTSD